jgi:hypothetical protein
MTTIAVAPRSLLRFALRLDAVVSALNGLAYVAVAPVLEDVLGLPAGPMRWVGAFLLLYGAAVWAVSTRPDPRAAGAVVVANLLWVFASGIAAVTGLGTPTAVGTAWIVLQAVVVAGFAALQIAGLRRQP